MAKVIRLTENQLHGIIRNAVNECINEGWFKNTALAGATALAMLGPGHAQASNKIDQDGNQTEVVQNQISNKKAHNILDAMIKRGEDYQKAHVMNPIIQQIKFANRSGQKLKWYVCKYDAIKYYQKDYSGILQQIMANGVTENDFDNVIIVTNVDTCYVLINR